MASRSCVGSVKLTWAVLGVLAVATMMAACSFSAVAISEGGSPSITSAIPCMPSKTAGAPVPASFSDDGNTPQSSFVSVSIDKQVFDDSVWKETWTGLVTDIVGFKITIVNTGNTSITHLKVNDTLAPELVYISSLADLEGSMLPGPMPVGQQLFWDFTFIMMPADTVTILINATVTSSGTFQNQVSAWGANETGELVTATEYDAVTLTATVNSDAPVANAGTDIIQDEDTMVFFNGSLSTDDISISNYNWTFNYNLSTEYMIGVAPSFTFYTPGTYTVQLAVTDGDMNYDTDIVNVTINDATPPTANAGTDQTVSVGTNVVFNGSTSFDNVAVTNYSWQFTDGSLKTLFSDSPDYTFNTAGIFVVTLTVMDDAGLNGTDQVTITVFGMPLITVQKIVNKAIAYPGDTLTYTIVYENIGNGTADQVWLNDTLSPHTTFVSSIPVPMSIVGQNLYWQFSNVAIGTYSITVTVTLSAVVAPDTLVTNTVTCEYTPSGMNTTDIATTIILDNIPPVANAGPDQSVNEGAFVTFDGSASTDNTGIVNYTWAFTYNATVTEIWDVSPSFRFWTPGFYNVTLTVFDANALSDDDTVYITVNDTAPVDTEPPFANAGSDEVVHEGETVQFDGSASTDNFGIVNYTWEFMDGIPVSLYGFNPNYTFNNIGVFNITLTVRDLAGLTDIDQVIIAVNGLPIISVTKTVDKVIANPCDFLNYTISFTNTGLGIADFVWVNDSLPAEVSYIADTSASVPGFVSMTPVGRDLHFYFENITPWSYQFTITVVLMAGLTEGTVVTNLVMCEYYPSGTNTTDSATVIILDSFPPVANAGPDQTVSLGTSVVFDGSSSNDNVAVANYSWMFSYNGDIVLLWGVSPVFTFNLTGTYLVSLTVCDGMSLTDTDIVIISVTGLPIISVNKIVDKRHTFAGDFLSYTIYFNNTGLLTASDVWVNDTLPAEVSYLSDTSGVGAMPIGQTMCYHFTNVTPGSHGFILNATINPMTAPGAVLLNEANCTFTPGGFASYGTATTIIDDATSPVANAGPDQTISQHQTIVFDGNASSDDVGIINYTWTFVYNGTTWILLGSTSSFTFHMTGTYVVTLTVWDEASLNDTDTMTVTVTDATAPVANAGPDQTVSLGNPVLFDGSASTDNVGIVNYTWNLLFNTTDGPLYGMTPSYQFPAVGAYYVLLTVMDGTGLNDTDMVMITIIDEVAPVANAGPDQLVAQQSLVTFDGSNSTDNVGIENYTWELTYNATVIHLWGSTPSFRFFAVGSYVVTLTVWDVTDLSDSDTMTVTVADSFGPVADAGPDQTWNPHDEVRFNGSLSTDNEGIANYSWSFTYNGTSVLLYDVAPSFIFHYAGVYIVTLTVRDAVGLTDTDTMVVTIVDTTTPSADAGPDQSVPQGTTVIFDGNGSTDNVAIVNYTWIFTYGGAPIVLSGKVANFSFLEAGTYFVNLTVYDAQGQNDTDSMLVHVGDTTSPTASAGFDQSVPQHSAVQFDGTGSTDNVDIANFTWTFTYDGIPRVLWTAMPTFIFDTVGSYPVILTVRDAVGNPDEDEMTVFVTDIDAPVADAGKDLTINEGSIVVLDGSGSVDNLGIVSYVWSFIYDWENVTLIGESVTYSFDIPGTYPVQLAVEDADGNQDIDIMVLTVENVNDAPTITSTPALTATEDVPYIYQVTADDPDLIYGDALTYHLIQGPSGMTMNATGVIGWLPGDPHIGENPVSVMVQDASGAMAIQQFSILVSNINDAPQFTDIPDTVTTVEGTPMTITPLATDPDSTNLTFMYDGNISGMAMPQYGPSWSWTPLFTQSGMYLLTVTVCDGFLEASHTVSIVVLEYGNNLPVILNEDRSVKVSEGTELVYQIDAYDADGDTLVYSFTEAPAGAVIGATTGLITWTPVWSQLGVNPFVVCVSDGFGSSNYSFTAVVSNSNNAPVPGITTLFGIRQFAGGMVNITLTVQGTSYQTVSLTVLSGETLLTDAKLEQDSGSTVVSLAAILDTNDVNQIVVGYLAGDEGECVVRLDFAYDGGTRIVYLAFSERPGANASKIFDLNALLADKASSARTVSFDASSSWDPDGDAMEFLWDFGDGGNATGQSVIHEYRDIGVYEVALTVTDALGSNTWQNFTVNITGMASEGVSRDVYSPSAQIQFATNGDIGEVAVRSANDPNGDSSKKGIGKVVEFELIGEDGTVLDSGTCLKYANITIPYDERALPEGLDESELRMYWWDETNQEWVEVPDCGVNTQENFIWGNVTHFTMFTGMSMDYTVPAQPVSRDFSFFGYILVAFSALIIGIGLTTGLRKPEWLYLATLAQVTSLFLGTAEKESPETGALLKGMIMAKPGVHYRWLMIQSGKGNGTVAYHLRKLEDRKEIVSKRDGMFKRYYPAGMRTLRDISEEIGVPIQKAILDVIAEHPGASESEISYLIDEPKQNVHYHLKKFEDEKVIIVKRDEAGNTSCYLNGAKTEGNSESGG